MRIDWLGAAAACAVAVAVWVQWPHASPFEDAQTAHKLGHCGSNMKPGPGLSSLEGGTVQAGWVASMIPGQHEFRVRGAGSVWVLEKGHNVATIETAHTVVIHATGLTPQSVIEWRPPGARSFEPIPREFLYPRVLAPLQDMVDTSIKYDFAMPGMSLKPSTLRDDRRLVPPDQYPGMPHVKLPPPSQDDSDL
jgi:hypothetical protein